MGDAGRDGRGASGRGDRGRREGAASAERFFGRGRVDPKLPADPRRDRGDAGGGWLDGARRAWPQQSCRSRKVRAGDLLSFYGGTEEAPARPRPKWSSGAGGRSG